MYMRFATKRRARCCNDSWRPQKNIFNIANVFARSCKYFQENLHTGVDFFFQVFAARGVDLVHLVGIWHIHIFVLKS